MYFYINIYNSNYEWLMNDKMTMNQKLNGFGKNCGQIPYKLIDEDLSKEESLYRGIPIELITGKEIYFEKYSSLYRGQTGMYNYSIKIVKKIKSEKEIPNLLKEIINTLDINTIESKFYLTEIKKGIIEPLTEKTYISDTTEHKGFLNKTLVYRETEDLIVVNSLLPKDVSEKEYKETILKREISNFFNQQISKLEKDKKDIINLLEGEK